MHKFDFGWSQNRLESLQGVKVTVREGQYFRTGYHSLEPFATRIVKLSRGRSVALYPTYNKNRDVEREPEPNFIN